MLHLLSFWFFFAPHGAMDKRSAPDARSIASPAVPRQSGATLRLSALASEARGAALVIVKP
jgi:hypothetical protein